MRWHYFFLQLGSLHVMGIFSPADLTLLGAHFPQAYGMMGWRVGYVAYPRGNPSLASGLLKVQDTIAICAAQVGSGQDRVEVFNQWRWR
jgi:hypothetical protein